MENNKQGDSSDYYFKQCLEMIYRYKEDQYLVNPVDHVVPSPRISGVMQCYAVKSPRSHQSRPDQPR